jgi:hypothetical protein
MPYKQKLAEGKGHRAKSKEHRRSQTAMVMMPVSSKKFIGFIEFIEFLEFYNPRNYVNPENCVNSVAVTRDRYGPRYRSP